MPSLVCILLLLAGSTTVELVDQSYEVPPFEARYNEVPLQHDPAVISAAYESSSGSADVKLELMRRQDLDLAHADPSRGYVATTAAGASGRLAYRVTQPGEYVIVVYNLAAVPAVVHVRVWLEFRDVMRISPQRQLTVIAISFAFFLGIVTFSARRLLRAVKR
jgi:hypothetical protein